MSIREQNVFEPLTMVGAGFYIKLGQSRRTQELGIQCQGPNGKAVAIVAQIIQLDVLRYQRNVRVVEELRHTCMAIIITALGLIGSHLHEFGIRIEGLVAARAEKDFRLGGEML